MLLIDYMHPSVESWVDNLTLEVEIPPVVQSGSIVLGL